MQPLHPFHRFRLNSSMAFALLLAASVVLLTVAPAMAQSGVVNINTADASQLALLPRVGPSVSERILQFREDNGPFKSAEDLMLVRGIGEKTFALLEPHVTISGDTTLTQKVKIKRPDPAQDNG